LVSARCRSARRRASAASAYRAARDRPAVSTSAGSETCSELHGTSGLMMGNVMSGDLYAWYLMDSRRSGVRGRRLLTSVAGWGGARVPTGARRATSTIVPGLAVSDTTDNSTHEALQDTCDTSSAREATIPVPTIASCSGESLLNREKTSPATAGAGTDGSSRGKR
jgi:hypothetical protein